MKLSEVTVVVPVWQCAERLTKHFAVVRDLVAAGCSIIWVASHSADNSHQLAQEEAERFRSRYLLTPRGLYASWNRGIREVISPYTYISTVGERIEPNGLEYFLDALRSSNADLVFSPPIIEKSDISMKYFSKWPVFLYQKRLSPYHHRIIPKSIVRHLQLISGYSCLLGSFASCLTRTSVLQKRPFPTNYHHYGDTAWFCFNMSHIDLAFINKPLCTFSIHNTKKMHINQNHKSILMKSIIDNASSSTRWHYACYRSCIRYLDAKRGIRPKHYWWLNPIVLSVRIAKGLLEFRFRSVPF